MSIAMTSREHPARLLPSERADLVDLILDKGMVTDGFVRVTPIGTEVLMIDARSVTASLDTYLRFADAVNRFDISGWSDGRGRHRRPPPRPRSALHAGRRLATPGSAPADAAVRER
jgi:gas vesicle protein GvpA/GvpJ/GvpM family